MRNGYSVNDLDQDGQTSFLLKLEDRADMTWARVIVAGRHALGIEMMDASAIKCGLPFGDACPPKFMVMRYHGKLPMVGWRERDVFHIVWVEARFGDVYDHG